MDVRDQLRVDTSRAMTTANISDAELSKRVAQKIAADIPGAKAGEDWWLTGWRVEGPDNRWNLVRDADRRADRLGAGGAASPDTSGTRDDTSSKENKRERR